MGRWRLQMDFLLDLHRTFIPFRPLASDIRTGSWMYAFESLSRYLKPTLLKRKMD